MSLPSPCPQEPRAEYRYHLLRAASERFQADFGALDPGQRSEVERQADQTFALETLVLATPEARDTLIPEQRIDEAVDEIRRRYPDEAGFLTELKANGLDATLLRQALRRELLFDAVMTRIGARVEPVTEIDERLFHELHRDRFTTPEQRRARHILITINDDYAENRREQARRRIEAVAAELNGRAEVFGAFAERHSECPTAMQQGNLGTLPPGRLYPELDTALFALGEGEVSGVLESEIGFHLLLCERIEPPRFISFEQARPRIRAILEARRRRDGQRAWIAGLRQQAPPRTERSMA
ncbi:nitrogen fixation protein NifM [Thiocystis violacea]|uniref:nitrogen fixation protein NifM n=1 Tax=Thiocystis violacea TaxID=13725 RepID=UPI001903B4B4|nr:nitrogen fixation protein NifM [Thiocystis violacea]MBK1719084.1 nitrogen fixation protein NifM [Thiocystis violacea]